MPVVTGGDQGSQAGEGFALNANLRLLLTKLSKKDTVTKFKALQELAPALEKVRALYAWCGGGAPSPKLS